MHVFVATGCNMDSEMQPYKDYDVFWDAMQRGSVYATLELAKASHDEYLAQLREDAEEEGGYDEDAIPDFEAEWQPVFRGDGVLEGTATYVAVTDEWLMVRVVSVQD